MSKNTFQTALSISNSMVSGALVVLPVVYLQSGIIENIISTIISSIMMGITAVVLVKRILPEEQQFAESVKRQLGGKYMMGLSILTSITTFLVASIVFLLASGILYDTCAFFFPQLQKFDEFWFSLCILVFFLPLAQLNSLKTYSNFAALGVGLMVSQAIILGYSIVDNVQNIDAGLFEIKPMNLQNIIYWLSISGFFFISHPTISPFIKENKNKKHDWLAVTLAYAITATIYILVGLLGAMALYKQHPKKQQNIITYFDGKWQLPVLGISFFVSFLTLFAIFPYASRTQIYEILPQKWKYKKQKTLNILKIVFTLLFVFGNAIFLHFKVDPGDIIGFIGAAACWYICYFLPIIMKIGILKKKEQRKSKETLLSAESLDEDTISGKELKNQTQSSDKIVVVGLGFILAFATLLMVGEFSLLFGF